MPLWERIGIYFMLLMCITVSFYSAFKPLSASRISVLNTDGTPCIVLSSNEQGAGRVTLYNKDGSVRSVLSGAISIYGKDGEERIVISPDSSKDACGFIQLKGSSSNSPHAEIYANDSGSGVLSLRSKSGCSLAYIGGDSNSGLLELGSSNSAPGVQLVSAPEGGMLTLKSSKGYPIVTAGPAPLPPSVSVKLTQQLASPVVAGGITTYNFDGKPAVAQGITSEGEGSLTLFNILQDPEMQFYPSKFRLDKAKPPR